MSFQLVQTFHFPIGKAKVGNLSRPDMSPKVLLVMLSCKQSICRALAMVDQLSDVLSIIIDCTPKKHYTQSA